MIHSIVGMYVAGLIDIVTKEQVLWKLGRGQNYERRKLTEKQDGRQWEATLNNHRVLIDTLSSMDDQLADTIIQQESLDNLDKKEIDAAIRRCTIDMKAFPVLCGSSYKNIGVQTLMDAVIDYLPSPIEQNDLYSSFGEDLSARAFKVQHDDQRGVLTFLRLYSGEFSKGQKIYNLARDCSEQVSFIKARMSFASGGIYFKSILLKIVPQQNFFLNINNKIKIKSSRGV